MQDTPLKTLVRLRIIAGLLLVVGLAPSYAAAGLKNPPLPQPSLLFDDFLAALDAYAHHRPLKDRGMLAALWTQEFTRRQLDRSYWQERLAGAAKRTGVSGGFDKYRTVVVAGLPTAPATPAVGHGEIAAALHAVRIDVEEDYDDIANDNLFVYFITTHGDLIWGRTTATYENLDEAESAFLAPDDRAIFGPRGEKLMIQGPLLVDIGIVESDGDDLSELKKLSTVIMDLAAIAIAAAAPEAAASAALARAETKNLLRAIIELDDDDRLATGTIIFSEAEIGKLLGRRSVHEFHRRFKKKTFWTRFSYRVNFRFMK